MEARVLIGGRLVARHAPAVAGRVERLPGPGIPEGVADPIAPWPPSAGAAEAADTRSEQPAELQPDPDLGVAGRRDEIVREPEHEGEARWGWRSLRGGDPEERRRHGRDRRQGSERPG